LENLFGFELHTVNRILLEHQNLAIAGPIGSLCKPHKIHSPAWTILNSNFWIATLQKKVTSAIGIRSAAGYKRSLLRRNTMKQQSALNWLVPLIVLLAVVSAGAGLFWQSEGSPYTFQTLYGETVEIHGQGLYHRDTVFSAGAIQGADAVTLLVGLPLLAVSFILYRRGSLRGGFLLVSVLAYFLYYGASLGLLVAYNNLYLVYLALFSASFFAFVLALTTFDLPSLPARFSPLLPRRGMAVFMFVVGSGVAFIWLSDVINALTTNGIPTGLGSHTALVTYTLDVGIIAPACFLAGILILRRSSLGYLLTGLLTIMLALIGAMVIGQTVMQLNLGLEFSTGELIGKIGSWIILGGIAVWLTIAFLRNLSDSTT